jgi:DNA repair protein RecN (Recombination protein N)
MTRDFHAMLRSFRLDQGPTLLSELRLENYAVIDNVVVEFAPGLNLLTGETGAGKSILIDALALLLGEKASSDIIRSGADRAVVAAVLSLERSAENAIAEILEANGLDAENESLILRREIAAGGKGRVFINNQPATVAVLRQLSPHLATIHAQHESLLSFDAPARLKLLDAYAGHGTDNVSAAFAQWKTVAARIDELEHGEQDRLKLLDLWTFQKREIEEAKLQAGEDERLETEKRVLANAEKIYSSAMNAFDLLYEGSASTSSSLQASPEHLAEVEDRLALLDRLKRKYGPSLDDVIRQGEEVRRKLSEMENKDEVLAQLKRELARAAEEFLSAGREASKKRHAAARKLEKLVEAEINDLAMKSSFEVSVASGEEAENWSASGFDRVAYLISTNPGDPLKPLEQIASGGELSRVLLALNATVEADTGAKRRKDSAVLRTMVFDEIDTGIGGRAAEAVGKKLKSLARSNQVLCVTHLPQIATFADHHYVIEKKQSAARTRTTVRKIEGDERTEEVARMLSGAKLTETSRKHAEQMIKANA